MMYSGPLTVALIQKIISPSRLPVVVIVSLGFLFAFYIFNAKDHQRSLQDNHFLSKHV